jgi:hypothetical protein
MGMGVDKARDEQTAIGAQGFWGLKAPAGFLLRTDVEELSVAYSDAAVVNDGALVIHGQDGAAKDQHVGVFVHMRDSLERMRVSFV